MLSACQTFRCFVFFLALACALCAIACAQTGFSNDQLQTFINVTDSDPATGLHALIKAEQWDEAAEMIVSLRDTYSDQLVELKHSTIPEDTRPKTCLSQRKYLNRVANNYLTKYTLLLDRWRDRVELRVSGKNEAGFENNEELRVVVERYALAEGGDHLMVELASRYAEAGQLEEAIWFLSQMDPRFERFRKLFGESAGDFHLPENSFDENAIAEFAARLLIMRVLHFPKLYMPDPRVPGFGIAGGLSGRFQNDVSWFRREFGNLEGRFGNKEGVLSDFLYSWEQDFLARKQETHIEHSTIEMSDHKGLSWSLAFDNTGNTTNQTTQTGPLPLFTRPIAINEQLIWRDTNRIYAAYIESGAPLIASGISPEGLDQAIDRYVVWENIDDSLQLPTSTGIEQHLLSNHANHVFGIFNQLESNCIVGIDFDRQGRLLPGFPIQPPGSSWQFEGPPVVQNGKLYVAARRYISADRIESHVLCYSLRQNEFRAPLTQVWSQRVCQSQLQPTERATNPGLRHSRRSACRLTLQENRIFYCNNNGAIVCLRESNGDIEWLVKYRRSNYSTDDPWQSQLPKRRFGLAPMVHRESVIVMPSDSRFVISINKYSGDVDWQTRLPASFQSLDVSDATSAIDSDVLLGGDQLVWLNRTSGNVRARYPPYYPNTQPGMRVLSERSRGYPAMGVRAHVDTLFFPTRDGIYVLFIQGHFTLISGTAEHVVQDPVLKKWQSSEFSGGGHLLIENGMMVITNSKEIRAIPMSKLDSNREQETR